LVGEKVFLRSHSWITGEASSSEAVASMVASAGFHTMARHLCFLLGSLKVRRGRLARRSHTTVTPLNAVEARMCCTFLFHSTHVMSLCADTLAPGVYVLGVAGLVTSQMKI
jgi:hypothetical protein